MHRWSLKQERFDNLGQWKHTRVDNPEWNKRALSWPVLPNGDFNEKYDWPMEGYLLPYAPPTRLMTSDPEGSGLVGELGAGGTGPVRMRVMKNGMSDQTDAIAVVAPVSVNLSTCIYLYLFARSWVRPTGGNTPPGQTGLVANCRVEL